ncbi:alpha/beta fold hydrolase [Speluncibacter jeojiensis]|uniref:Alpha/beta hydrolase n=1 Tax=Speluncibacter jeojiensis TaxID=2710754 RepID=A0A9X4RFX7_9ACTN|nr:alpha/beta hydrolase [Corynebacteriales bacterium D3-21]
MLSSTAPLSVRSFAPAGAPSGPPVLLVHGFTSDGATDWLATGWPQALNAAGRTVVVPDLRGHGDSPAPSDPGQATPTAMVDDMIAALDGAATVDVIGYSLGARLAWELPHRAGLTVRRMVLGGLSPVEPFGAVDLDAVRAHLDGAPAPADGPSAMITAMVTAPGLDSRALTTCIEGLREEPFEPTTFDLPTLFVAGAADPMTAGLGELAALIPGAAVVEVPGDHLGALRSNEFRSAALDFLAVPEH